MQWSAMRGFMQELSLMVIDEGQQYGTDREIAVISLLQQQPSIIWTGNAEQTPSGIARTAPNAKRSRQLLLAKKHGLRFFFSVLRLCGSCQVVASCRADERITQMHSLYPSLGVQKWSKITTKWCQFQNEKPTKTQQETNTHNPHPKTTPNKNKTQKGTWHDGSKKQWHQVLLN